MSSLSPLALFNGSYLGKKPTGIGVVSRDLINAIDPNLVALLDPLNGVRQGSIPIPGNLTPDFGKKGHIRRLIWTQTKTKELLKNSGAELFLSPLPEAPLLRGIRSVVIAHDLIPIRFPRLSPLLAYHLTYVPLVLHRSERILCNSEATLREVNERMGISLKKLIKIPLGVSRDNLYPMNLRRKPFFLLLGRHDPHKNIQQALRAISLLPWKEIELKIVGPHDRRYTPKLKALASHLGINNQCSWIPWVTDEEKLNLLNTCQGLLIPSLWEGFGLPALEAMACDTPVIASSAGAIPEVVGDAGLMVNPKSAEEISDAMKQILVSVSLREDLVTRGRDRLIKYTWKKSARIIESVINEL